MAHNGIMLTRIVAEMEFIAIREQVDPSFVCSEMAPGGTIILPILMHLKVNR